MKIAIKSLDSFLRQFELLNLNLNLYAILCSHFFPSLTSGKKKTLLNCETTVLFRSHVIELENCSVSV